MSTAPQEPNATPSGGVTGWIVSFVRHPNAANLLMALMLLLGVYGILKINTQFFPTVETNNITVSVAWQGSTSEDTLKNILDVVEPEVRFLDNVDKVVSYAREGSASITLEFEEGADMQKALSDVEQAVAGITTLPEGSESPIVTRAQFYETVAKVAVRGPFSETALKSFARTVRDRLLDAGIDKVTFEGLRQGELVAEIEPADLRRLGLTVQDVAREVADNSTDVSSGNLDGTMERQVRVLGDAETTATLGAIEIVSGMSGERVQLRDIATVREGVDEDEPRGLSQGQTAIELTVQRAANADTLQMAENLRDGLVAARAELPASVEIVTYQESANRVEERIGLLLKNGLGGLVLVVLILFVFLNARVALWVAAGVPVALMATIGLMYVSGQSINMLSLFALIMTLGIIVDDAIVVGEHTATRYAQGDDAETAAVEGAGRMITPVVAAMMTTAAAFAPILLIGDVIGQIMGAIPLVALAVLVASLIECFFILPGHLSHALKARKASGLSLKRLAVIAGLIAGLIAAFASSEGFATGMGLLWLFDGLSVVREQAGTAFPFAVMVLGLGFGYLVELVLARMAPVEVDGQSRGFRAWFDGGFEWTREALVRPVVAATVEFRYATFAACIAAFVIAIGMMMGGRIPFVFFPSPEAENINASITFNSGLSEEAAVEAVRQIEAALVRAEADLTAGTDEELLVASFVTLGKAGQSRGDNLASISVELSSSEIRTVRTPDVVQAWQAAVPSLSGVKRVSISEARGGPPGRDLDVRLKDASPQALKRASLELQTVLSGIPGVSGIDDDLPYGKPELAIQVTPRGAALGFTVQSVGQQVRDAIDGRIARKLPTPEEEIDVRILQKLDGTGGALRGFELRAPDGSFVPLPEVVDVIDRQGFSVIQRRDGEVVVSVTADVNASVITNGEIVERLTQDGIIQDIAERAGARFEFSGRAEERADAFADLQLGAIVAAGTIYIILAWLFAHYAQPIAVMIIIPFGLVGSLFGHYLMDIPLTIISMIGLLGLSGILVNDSIILVARYKERLRLGEDVPTAATGASCDRLRAILLTTLSTVGGLTPLLFETSLQAQFLLPMAVTIVFGLAMATVFVLFLVPSMLAIGWDIQRIARFLGGPLRRVERDAKGQAAPASS